jgi:phosphate transport system substrate-binding protein
VRAFLQQKQALGAEIDRVTPEEIHINGVIEGKQVTVVINAHGSSTAFSDLSSGKAQIGMSSRPFTASEAGSVGNVKERVLGLDGVVIVVNSASSLSTTTKTQLADIRKWQHECLCPRRQVRYVRYVQIAGSQEQAFDGFGEAL